MLTENPFCACFQWFRDICSGRWQNAKSKILRNLVLLRLLIMYVADYFSFCALMLTHSLTYYGAIRSQSFNNSYVLDTVTGTLSYALSCTYVLSCVTDDDLISPCGLDTLSQCCGNFRRPFWMTPSYLKSLLANETSYTTCVTLEYGPCLLTA